MKQVGLVCFSPWGHKVLDTTERLNWNKQIYIVTTVGFPGGTSGKESTWQFRRQKRSWFDPWVGKNPWKRKWQPTPVFFPEKSHIQGSLAAIVHGVAKYQTVLSIWIQREGEREKERERNQCRRVLWPHFNMGRFFSYQIGYTFP